MLEDPIRNMMQQHGWTVVATGTWFYDRIVPKPMTVYAKPARLSSSRFDEDDQLDESRPIPETKDGFFYVCWPGGRGEHLTIDDAKADADSTPWGPVIWD
jgi:hypothetical protein